MTLKFKSFEKKTMITLLATLLIALVTLAGSAQINAWPKRCLICHSMKPEYYTWMASPHGKAKVSCLSCHSSPTVKGFFIAKAQGFKEIHTTIQASYISPIKMKAVIDDKACERCHSSKKLENREYGDMVISHQSHKVYKVACAKCHTGLAHGQIADRKATYAGDYPRWEKTMGESLMTEKSYTKPDMDTCFRCHRLRNGPTTCTACHKTSKTPASHRQPDFQGTGHGLLANSGIKTCHNCHRLMTQNNIEEFEEGKAFEEFLSGGKTKQKITASYYSRVNNFCKDCHSKKPKSHKPNFISIHREQATKSKTGCLTCHNNQHHRADPSVLGSLQSITRIAAQQTAGNQSQINDAPPSSIVCSSCHPALHSEDNKWKAGLHPVPISPNPKITRYCYYCHRESECSTCHGKVQAVKITKEE